MAIPQNQIPQNAQEMILNMAKAFGLDIEIKGSQEQTEIPQQTKKHRGRKLPKVLTPEKVKALLKPINTKCSTGLRNMAMLMTAYKAGLRVSEICDLPPADIDFSKGMILVQDGKGGKDRLVPIGAELIKWLQQWDDIRPQSKYFFCALKGTRLSPRYFNQLLERLSNKSGIYLQDRGEKKPISIHVLRHCYASNLLDQDVNIREVQELLGHSSIQTTTIYTHVSVKNLDKKIKALG